MIYSIDNIVHNMLGANKSSTKGLFRNLHEPELYQFDSCQTLN